MPACDRVRWGLRAMAAATAGVTGGGVEVAAGFCNQGIEGNLKGTALSFLLSPSTAPPVYLLDIPLQEIIEKRSDHRNRGRGGRRNPRRTRWRIR